MTQTIRSTILPPPVIRSEITQVGAVGPPGTPGAPGPNIVSEDTSTNLTGLLYGDGNNVSSLNAVSGRAFLDVFSQSQTLSVIASALGAYTPTSGLAAIATSGNAADLFGTLDNSRLSAQVVRNDFSYADPSWITSLAASKITGSFVNITTTGNGSITGTLQLGGAAGHLLRWNAGASSLELRDSTNAFYRKMRVGELQAIADLGGSFATPANARIGLLTQIGGYLAGAISGRTYSANAAHGDIVISASLDMTLGQNNYSALTDDLVLRGNTGNVEINRGLLSIGMAGQSARSLSILPVNTGDRTGVRVYDYGTFASGASQSGFEVAYLGGTFASPSTAVAGHYRNLLSFRAGGSAGTLFSSPSFVIRSTIGSIIGSSLSEVNTSLMVTPTSTGTLLAAITLFGQTGLVDFPVGQIQLGTNVRLKNSSGNLQVRNSADSGFTSLEAFNGTFNNYVTAVQGIFAGSGGAAYLNGAIGVGTAVWLDYTANTNTLFRRDATNGRMHVTYTQGASAAAALTQFHSRVTVDDYLTSAFQTLAADPTTSNITSGLARLVKNTTSGEIAEWANDGGTMRKLSSTQGALSFRVDGGGAVPATGPKKFMFRVPYKCTLTGWEVVADVSGSVVVDVWKNATYPPVNADSIVASAKPTLSSGLKASSTTLTGWTTLLNTGDYIEIEVESAATLTAFTLTLTVTRA